MSAETTRRAHAQGEADPPPDSVIEVDPRTTALVVVDMQNDFCTQGGYSHKSLGRDVASLARPTAPIRALIERSRRAGMAVMFTRLVHDEKRGAIEQRHRLVPKRWVSSGRRYVDGSWGAAVIDALRPTEADLIVDKVGYSAFEGTILERQLRERGIRTIVLTGVVTYACVLSTAFSAFDRGFDVIVVSDAVGTLWDHLGGAALEMVDLLLGHAIPSDRLAIGRTG
jgi:nicotinamidase-related amidase